MRLYVFGSNEAFALYGVAVVLAESESAARALLAVVPAGDDDTRLVREHRVDISQAKLLRTVPLDQPIVVAEYYE